MVSKRLTKMTTDEIQDDAQRQRTGDDELMTKTENDDRRQDNHRAYDLNQFARDRSRWQVGHSANLEFIRMSAIMRRAQCSRFETASANLTTETDDSAIAVSDRFENPFDQRMNARVVNFSAR